MGDRAYPVWPADAAAMVASVMILMAVGTAPFGHTPTSPGTTVPLALTWTAALLAAVVTAVAVGTRRPPRASGAGFVALALVIPGLATGDAAAGVKVAAVAVGAALPLSVATFVWLVAQQRSRVTGAILGLTAIATVAVRVTLRDPFQDLYCAPYCGENPLLVVAQPGWVQAADRTLAVVVLAWCGTTLVLVVRARLSVWSRASAGLAIGAAAIAAMLLFVEQELTIWGGSTGWAPALVPAALIGAFAAAVPPHLQAWRTRVQAHHLAGALADTFARGGVTEHLRQVIQDPSIQLFFPTTTGNHLGPTGEPAERGERMSATTVERDGEAIAVIEHAPEARDRVGAALTPGLTIALDNERLRAMTHAELAELRASRRRIVDRADAARRGLERDLHDGAQQRLLLLGMELSRAATHAGDGQSEPYRAAISHTQDALAELRNLVHEQLPPILDELGLVEALRSLAETSPLPLLIEVGPSSARRRPPAIEHAVYAVARSMVAGVDTAGATRVNVRLSDRDGTFTAAFVHDGTRKADPTDLEDRVGAAGGTLAVMSTPDRVDYEATFS